MKVGCIKGKDVRFVLAMVLTTLIVVLTSMTANAMATDNIKSKGIIDFGNGIKFDASDITNLNNSVEELKVICK